MSPRKARPFNPQRLQKSKIIAGKHAATSRAPREKLPKIRALRYFRMN
jgi:hypothetical protein